MVSKDPVPFILGDVVRLKKSHPCGGFDWAVVRLGADIGLKCLRCGRRVLLPRRELERRLKQFLERGLMAEDANTCRESAAVATSIEGHS